MNTLLESSKIGDVSYCIFREGNTSKFSLTLKDEDGESSHGDLTWNEAQDLILARVKHRMGITHRDDDSFDDEEALRQA